MSKSNLNTLTVAVVLVEDEDKILMVQEAKEMCRGKWTFPGGRTERAESIIETAIREVKEESGIDVELEGLIYIDQHFVENDNGIINRIRFVFKAKPIGGELKKRADNHSLKAAWLSRSEIGELDVRSPIIMKMISILDEKVSMLPISSFQVISEEQIIKEQF